MFDLANLIRTAVAHANGDRVVVAAPYDLGEFLCEEQARNGELAGYIKNSAPDSANINPFVAGWWIDRDQGCWFIRPSAECMTIVLLGTATHRLLSPDLLLEARRKRVGRLLVFEMDGRLVRSIDLAGTFSLEEPSSNLRPLGELSYESVFRAIRGRIGNRLRLPLEMFGRNRVLMLAPSLGPGGSERQAAYSAVGLVETGRYEVHIGCNRVEQHPDNLFRPLVEAAGVKVLALADEPSEYDTRPMRLARTRLAKYNSISVQNILHAILQYASIIREVRPSIVHTWTDYCNVFGGIAAELVGVPRLVLGGRSLSPDNYAHLFHPYMRPGYLSIFEKKEVTFIHNSEAGASDYARWLDQPTDMFEVVYNGCVFPDKTQFARAASRRSHGIPSDAEVVGTITRFSEEKRPDLFLDMAKHVHLKLPRVHFLMVGGGPMLEQMREYSETLGLSEIVTLFGVTSDSWAALSAMDIFVLTSRIEGLPNVLIEAQASGLPVVCTGAGGMNETFVQDESGYSTSAAPEALAEYVIRLLENPTLRLRMSRRAEQQARERFGLDAMLKKTIEIYSRGLP